jgi:hypothetical protein
MHVHCILVRLHCTLRAAGADTRSGLRILAESNGRFDDRPNGRCSDPIASRQGDFAHAGFEETAEWL